MFWRQSETRDFARLFISKCQVIRVTDEKKPFPGQIDRSPSGETPTWSRRK
jgi:hypothetical protein